MIEPLVFVVPGTPQGKGRPRFSSKVKHDVYATQEPGL